jgi:hypothetical protein
VKTTRRRARSERAGHLCDAAPAAVSGKPTLSDDGRRPYTVIARKYQPKTFDDL